MINISKYIPDYVAEGLCYLTICGSTAYGTASEGSDIDLVGIYVPPHENLYPQEYGFINGFDGPKEAVDTFQAHHIMVDGIEYDINVFNIIKFFKLATAGNPNIIDAISTNQSLHLFKNRIGKLIYENRKQFLSKDMYPKFRGMIKSHMATISKPQTGHGHKDLIEKFGYDTKDAAHSIRVMLSLIDVLTTGDYKTDAHSSFIKDIREGVYSLDTILTIHRNYDESLEEIVKSSILKDSVDKFIIKTILQECIDLHHEYEV